MTTFGRRPVLSGLLWTAALPAWARSTPANPDVVVVGAGSAGLAAARALIGAGRTVVVVEARDRIGGRAFTDTATFGMPFDRGCSWTYSVKGHPWRQMAEAWGYHLSGQERDDEIVYVGDREATDAEYALYDKAADQLEAAFARAGRAGKDVSAASVSPRKLPWIEMAEAWAGPMEMGMDLDDVSCLDWWLNDSPGARGVAEGYGTLVHQFGHDFPVTLDAPVSRIRWGGPGVTVETAKGTLAAKAAIVTVSTGVLAAEAIRFDPPLPAWKREAIEGVPMGLLVKVPLLFNGARFDLAPEQWLSYPPRGREACYFQAWPFDRDLMVGFMGGRFAWEISAAGEAAAVDFARGELRKMFGSAVDKAFVKGAATQWASDPWARGAYTCARPGRTADRMRLAEPLGDRLYFAGEAMAGRFSQTCDGAFLSGQAVGRELAARLT
ncbi:flavin monoamine oxidase family protein [Desertibaculum subflavum]|uniref:flavin monoamine oxidase family protein n=1 Tax=Desertibaculum subflavum TaxID=2268458 RepID=UPI000E671309